MCVRVCVCTGWFWKFRRMKGDVHYREIWRMIQRLISSPCWGENRNNTTFPTILSCFSKHLLRENQKESGSIVLLFLLFLSSRPLCDIDSFNIIFHIPVELDWKENRDNDEVLMISIPLCFSDFRAQIRYASLFQSMGWGWETEKEEESLENFQLLPGVKSVTNRYHNFTLFSIQLSQPVL